MDGDRVVPLHQRVEQFGNDNLAPRFETFLEIFAGDHLLHGSHPRDTEHVGVAEVRQPFAVAADFEFLRGGIEDQPRLVDVGAGVGLDLFQAQHRARRIAA